MPVSEIQIQDDWLNEVLNSVSSVFQQVVYRDVLVGFSDKGTELLQSSSFIHYRLLHKTREHFDLKYITGLEYLFIPWTIRLILCFFTRWRDRSRHHQLRKATSSG